MGMAGPSPGQALPDWVREKAAPSLVGGNQVDSGISAPALRALIHDLVFSVTDLDTIAWATGSLVLSDGTVYAITGGNTGNMSARTFVYFDRAASTTTLTTTTTLATAIGDDKCLIATAINGTTEPEYVVYGGIGGLNVNGSIIIPGTIGSSSLNLADRGWIQTCAFSVTDLNTVAWASGSFIAADGTTYSIGGGNTGNMAAATYIYLDIAVSTTAYQTTTTATTSVGAGKVLVAVAQNGTDEATFEVFISGVGGTNLHASNIVASSISANELAAGSVTAGKISVTSLAAINADLGAITAGTIVLPSGGFVRSGQTAYNTGTGWYIGNDSGTTKFSIGDGSVNLLTWDGTTFTVKGVINAADASVIGSNALSLSDDAGFGRNYLRNGSVESWSAGTTSAPDGWALTGAGATIARSTSNFQYDLAGVDVTAALNTATDLAQTIAVSSTVNPDLRGRTFTLSCRVKASTASRVFLKIDDGVGTTSSSNHTGGGGWETLSVTRSLNASATKLECSLEISSGASITASFDGVCLVRGSAIVAYSSLTGDRMMVPRSVSDADIVTITDQTTVVDLTDMSLANVILNGSQSVLLTFTLRMESDTTGERTNFYFYRDSTEIGLGMSDRASLGATDGSGYQSVSMQWIDRKPAAGSYTYKIKWHMTTGGTTGRASNRVLTVAPYDDL